MGSVCPVKSNSVEVSYNFELIEISSLIKEISVEIDHNLQTKDRIICGWRLKAHPDIEVKLLKSSKKIFYSLYPYLEEQPLEVPLSSRILSTFQQCIWKESSVDVESRLFKDDAESSNAILVSVDLRLLKIKQHIWQDYPNDFLKEYQPKISMNHEGAFEFDSRGMKREQQIFTWYEPQAEEGMIRQKQKEGSVEGGYLETTLRVWSNGPEIRLIKRRFDSQKNDFVCNVFNRKKSVYSHSSAP